MAKRIVDLVEQLEPSVRVAFLLAVGEITSKAEIGRISRMLEHGDIEGALAALHIDRAAFSDVENAIATIYEKGGRQTVGNFPVFRSNGARVVVRFDVRNLRAEQWLRGHSSTLVTNITEDQLAGLRAVLAEGLAAGRNPRSVALDIVGRIGRAGTRQGGLIGLTAQQSRAAANARSALLSGDPTAMRAYLTRGRRDHRFDSTVEKAIAAGKAVDAKMVDRIIGRYADRLLQLRGETIARTETLAALHQAQDEAFRQAVDAGVITASQVRRAWHSAGDKRVRDTHAAMSGNSVGLNEPFLSPSGASLMYPCDPSAPASETINCRCWVENRIDFLANIR